MSHFERGFGLPISEHMKKFLRFYRLQPHHLPANAILSLSVFTTFCEAYLGLLPTVNLWRKFFGFKRNIIPDKGNPNKESTQCGAASISPKRGSILPRIPRLESCKMWQKSFFYARNPVPEEHEDQLDFIGLPPFVVGPPTNTDKWKQKLSGRDKEGKATASRVEDLIKMGFRGDDMVATFVHRRVLQIGRASCRERVCLYV